MRGLILATAYIVVGCPTTGGGKVITGSNFFLIDGIPIACVGDTATCPKHQTVSTIITGDPHMQVMGKMAARVNDSLSCGCKLLPKQNLVVQENSSSPIAPKVTAMSTNILTTNNKSDSLLEDKKEIHKIQFQVLNEDTNLPLTELLYEIRMKGSGELLVQGYTDKDGKTVLYDTEYKQEAIELVTIDLSKPLPTL